MHPVFIDGTDLSKYEQAKRRFIDANETCRDGMHIIFRSAPQIIDMKL